MTACATIMGLLPAAAILMGSRPLEAAPAAATRPALSPSAVRQLVNQLDHPQFKTRQAATQVLCDATDDSLPAMVRAYMAQTDLEFKLRLRYAIEHVYYRKLLEGRLGFLGVAMTSQADTGIYNPLTGRPTDAIRFARVLPGYPAEKAGFKDGDVIIEFDGKPILDIIGRARPQQQLMVAPAGQLPASMVQRMRSHDPRIDAFTAEVSGREPGSTVTMQLLRCQPSDRSMVMNVGNEPARALDGARLVPTVAPAPQAAPTELAGMLMRPVLYVQSVVDKSPAANVGLKAGDLLAGLGPTIFSGTATPEQVAVLLKSYDPHRDVRLIVNRMETVKIAVTLGGRPPDRLNDIDMEIAQARFADWWRTQTGEGSLRNPIRWNLYNDLPRPATVLPDPTVLP